MNFRGKVAIGLLCGILGLTISLQFNTVRNTTGGGFLSTQRAQQLSMELRSLRSERERLNEELANLENRLKEYEISEADENLIIKNLKRDLERYQLLAGYKEGVGPGVVVTINDQDNNGFLGGEGSVIMYNYDILLQIVNQLNAAGAEAIAINDQRYTAVTEIYYASNAVLINGVPTRPPYTIRAVGNPETLEAALNMRYGVIWEIRNYYNNNLLVNVRREEAVEIPRYNRPINYQYARPIEPSQ